MNAYSKNEFAKLFAVFILLFIGRMAIPYTIFVFIPASILFLAYIGFGLYKNRLNSDFSLTGFIRSWWSILLLMFAFLWAIILNPISDGDAVSKLAPDSFLLKDTIHLFVFLFTAYVLTSFFQSKKYFIYFLYKMMNYLVALALLAATLGIIKYTAAILGADLNVFKGGISARHITSLLSDYNFYSYTILLGMISLLILMQRKKECIISRNYAVLFSIFSTAVIFSSSRRGIVILSALMLILLYISVFRIGNLPKAFTYKLKKTLFGFGALILVLFTSITLYSHSYSKQFDSQKAFEDNRFTRSISSISYRYARIINKDVTYGAVSNYIWGDKDKTVPERGAQVGSRTERFTYALQIFSDKYEGTEKVFGKGFYYTELYAQEFFSQTKPLQHDYPHNFILSCLLYSGIIGLFVMIVFLIHTAINLIKSGNSFLYLTVYLGLGLLFNLISGNSIFSVPVFFLTLMVIIHNYSLSKSYSYKKLSDKSAL